MGSSACAVIQARLTSTRLSEKILADIGGVPLLQHVIDRARTIDGVDDVIVAVPDDGTTFRIQSVIPDIRIVSTPQVAESDVLGRFAAIAGQFESHDVFVRLTGDNPCIDPEIAATILREFREHHLEYHSNLIDGYVDGTDVEVFTSALVRDLNESLSLDDPRREHVTPAMGQPVITRVHPVRLTVDTQADLDRVRAILAKVPKGDYTLAATLKAAKVVK